MLRKVFTLCFVAGFTLPNASVYSQSRAQEKAVIGGVAGAILGGIAGHQNDETPEGIAIGGAVGAIAGGLLGRAEDEQMMRQYQYQEYQRQQHAQQVSRSVSINDAITMSRSGVSPNLIINQLRTNGVQQRIGVQEIILLHENGVPEVVIQEMQKAPIAGTNPVVVAQQSPPVVVRQPGIVIERQPNVIIETYPGHTHYHYRRHVYHPHYGWHWR